jgi:hypothetical protein
MARQRWPRFVALPRLYFDDDGVSPSRDQIGFAIGRGQTVITSDDDASPNDAESGAPVFAAAA